MSELMTVYYIIVPIVLVASALEGVWQSRSRPEGYDWKAWGTSLVDLMIRRLLVLVPFTLSMPAFAWAYEYRLFTPDLESVGGLLLLFFSLEFFYYWFHRASHTVRWFWNTHSVHHSPNRFTLSAAYRLGWMGKFTGATIFFTPMALLGFPPGVIVTALSINLMYQFWIHADWIPRLGWLEGILNTPSAHRVHHARNPEYLDANFGGVLVIFDRLFGTYVAEREDRPCQYGLVTPVTTYNPVLINFGPWIGMVKDLAGAKSLREIWHYLFGAPGWRPDGKGLTTRELRAQAAMT